MAIISIGQIGLNVLLHVVKLLEHDQLDTLAIFLIIMRLNLAIFLTAVIHFHGPTGVHALQHASPVFKNVLMAGHATTKPMLLNADHVTPVPVSTLTGLHGMPAHKLVSVVLK